MKTAWITGASSGIGEELAIQLSQQDYTLILSARSLEKLELVKSRCKNNEKHLVVQLDLSQTESINEIVQSVFQKIGQLDEMYHCGGLSQRSEAWETNIEIDRYIMEVNYFGTIALTKAILPFFQARKSGKFIVISSIAGKFGFYLRSAYSASKHALHGFFESLSLEEAKNNIQITIVCPGKINTPISTNALTKEGKAYQKMDRNQSSGMPVFICVANIIKAKEKGKREVLIGNKEIKAVGLKRFFPKLFWKIIEKQKATE